MSDFAVIAAIDPQAAEDPEYIATYVIRAGGHEIYRVPLRRGPGMIRLNRFGSLVPRCPDFEIQQTDWVGLRKIAVRTAARGLSIGEIRGPKLYFEKPNQIVGFHDAASPMKRTLRWALRGYPNRFVFVRAVDRMTIGWIEAPPDAMGPWPVRMVKALRRKSSDEAQCVWLGQLDCPDLDFRLFAALAVVLHSDQAGRRRLTAGAVG
ncbi:MAG: hypothetical protein QNJ61_02200 [Desulfobacterales bacterium]|nr:hypothetical protein [Desulfobacterales bacterium]